VPPPPIRLTKILVTLLVVNTTGLRIDDVQTKHKTDYLAKALAGYVISLRYRILLWRIKDLKSRVHD